MGRHQLWMSQLEPQLYVWQDDAACSGADVNLFAMLDPDEPALEGLSPTELDEVQAERFDDAQSYCDRCPVRGDCLKSATSADRKYTIRGGQLPKSYEPPKNKPKFRKCRNNHVVPATDYRCLRCRRDREKERRARNAEMVRFRAGQDSPESV